MTCVEGAKVVREIIPGRPTERRLRTPGDLTDEVGARKFERSPPLPVDRWKQADY